MKQPQDLPSLWNSFAYFILHPTKKDSDVKEFDENTWKTAKRASNVRKEKYKSSKYASVCETLQSLNHSEK